MLEIVDVVISLLDGCYQPPSCTGGWKAAAIVAVASQRLSLKEQYGTSEVVSVVM